MPQDKALLLLADPSTPGAEDVAAGAGGGPLWDLLLVVGLLMLVAGPLLWWARETGHTER